MLAITLAAPRQAPRAIRSDRLGDLGGENVTVTTLPRFDRLPGKSYNQLTSDLRIPTKAMTEKSTRERRPQGEETTDCKSPREQARRSSLPSRRPNTGRRRPAQ